MPFILPQISFVYNVDVARVRAVSYFDYFFFFIYLFCLLPVVAVLVCLDESVL